LKSLEWNGGETQPYKQKNFCTLVNVSVGNDTPKKKPNTTPTKVVTISLIVSFGFLRIPLHPKRCPCYELRIKRGKKRI